MLRGRSEYLWWAVSVALVVMVGAWLGPHLLAAYHLETGGRALEAALEPVFSDRLAPEEVTSPERLEAAVVHLLEALRWDPQSVQALRFLARAYISQGQPEAALEAVQRAVTLRPGNPLLRLELGDVYDSLGWAVEAVRAYETGGIGSRVLPLVANYLKLAEAQWAAGDGETAVAFFQRVLDLDPTNLFALYSLAQIYGDLGDVEQVGASEQRLRDLELSSLSLPPDSRLAEYQGQAMAALVGSELWSRETLLNMLSYQMWLVPEGVDYLMAERFLRAVLEQWGEDAQILHYLAELHYRHGDLAGAVEVLRQAVTVGPEYGPGYLRLGAICEEWDACGPEQAATWYALYHSRFPEDLLGLYHLAQACQALDAAGQHSEYCESDGTALMTGWMQRLATAEPRYRIDQQLDDGWTLLGIDVDADRLVRGELVGLLVFWEGPPSGGPGPEQAGWYEAGGRWVQVLPEVHSLLLNGGFELGLDDGFPIGFPQGMYQADAPTGRLTSETRAGQRTTVALLANTDTYSRTGLVSASVPVDPDASYLLGGWIRSVGGNGFLGQRWRGDIAADARYYDYVAAGVGLQDWQWYAGVTRPLEGSTECQIWLLNFMATGSVYFDDVIMVEIGLPDRWG